MDKIVHIKFFADKEFVVPQQNGDYIDLKSAVDMEWKAGDSVLIPLGVGMVLPKDHSAIVVPRSSTAKHFGLMMINSVGIIDNAYCGDCDQWHFAGYAVRDGSVSKGDRICQFRIEKKQPKIVFVEVKTLLEESRGGFGSTGVR